MFYLSDFRSLSSFEYTRRVGKEGCNCGILWHKSLARVRADLLEVHNPDEELCPGAEISPSIASLTTGRYKSVVKKNRIHTLLTKLKARNRASRAVLTACGVSEDHLCLINMLFLYPARQASIV